MPISVVDLFAGPGGLGEGFQTLPRLRPDLTAPFDVVSSYEKDGHAIRTLRFRAAFHACAMTVSMPSYFSAANRWGQGAADPDLLLAESCREVMDDAESRVNHLALTQSTRDHVRTAVRQRVGRDPWVLVGGPPCQAYSIVGRARNSGNPSYDAKLDERQTLYEEYLHLLATGRPEVFILENVKGLLSASLENRWIFGRMLADLADPLRALGKHGQRLRYRLYSVVTGKELNAPGLSQLSLGMDDGILSDVYTEDLTTTVVRMEQFGIPQARHRMILMGVRGDLLDGRDIKVPALRPSRRATVADVLSDLPAVRSRLSGGLDTPDEWTRVIRSAPFGKWRRELQAACGNGSSRGRIDAVVNAVVNSGVPRSGYGGRLVSGRSGARMTRAWLPRVQAALIRQGWSERWLPWFRGDVCGIDFGFANHESRGHMAADLHRYIFASTYGWLNGARSPRMAEFPRALYPQHRNVGQAVATGHFADRFRVQLAFEPSRTITSHIHKDGHYFIHFDPSQARSFTVREAARIQTFPDSYVFLGPRTEQFRQVGNAVPPLLAAQVAEIVWEVFRQVGIAK